MLREFRPDLIVLGPLNGGSEVRTLLCALQAQTYGGKVMLFGGPQLVSTHTHARIW